MKKATQHISHFRAVSVQTTEIRSFSTQEPHVLPVNLPTLPYGTHVPYGQIVMLRIIIWFQIMDHRNFMREFLHYFSSLLVNYGHRCSFHRKCRANLKCESHTFTISIRRRKSTAITCRVVCMELFWYHVLISFLDGTFCWLTLLKILKHLNCSWRPKFDGPRNSLCFCLIENIAYCHESARKRCVFLAKTLDTPFSA
jgi:hypothetical protein